MKIDLEQIKNLLDIVGHTDITELTIEAGEEKVTIKKSAPQLAIEVPHYAPAAAAPAPVAAKPAAAAAAAPVAENKNDAGETNGLVPIASPMVGTFYRAASPTAQPFVDVGDVIRPGQTVCIIEAMKLMNDLPAEVTGRVVRICVENGTTVEYGQPLFMVNPNV